MQHHEHSPVSDIAIIGMACVFPGARDLQSYWRNIVSKVDSVSEPPRDWDEALYYDKNSSANDRTYCKRGGYLHELAQFNAVQHGVMPNALDGEPDQFLALKVTADALEDARSAAANVDRSRVEVVLGRGTYINRGLTTVIQHGVVIDQVLRILKQLHPEHTDAELQELKRELKASLPPFNAEVAPALVPNLVTGRIANRLDFMGANYTVDAACASSLIAIERGMQDLRLGVCDLAVVGGIHASTPAPILMIFSQLGALSRKGEIRPFDEGADGTLLGEGAGVIVIKRCEDAERDGDRIYAVLKSVGVASDGRAVGLLAPRVEGEELALRRAYEAAGISPRTVGLMEAHGTGTAVGDATEMEALRRVFGCRDGEPPRCAIGTVKSMISHLIPAAGVAGVIKTALALYFKVLPPTLHCEKPNPKLELEKSRFYINTETRPWIHGGAEPRRAGVNAFGFGGINAHIVLEECSPRASASDPTLYSQWDSEVCIVEGETRGALIHAAKRLQNFAMECPQSELKDIAYTCNSPLRTGTRRLAIVASSVPDLDQKLLYAISRLEDRACSRIREVGGIYFFEEPLAQEGTLAFLFPGEGSQYPGMMADLCMQFPEARACFDLMDRAFTDHPRKRLPSDVIFPPPLSSEDPESLFAMDCGPEAVFSASQAMLSILRNLKLRPRAVAGHSTGEYSAFIACGANPLGTEELVHAIRDLNSRYEAFVAEGRIPKAALLTVGGVDREYLLSLLDDRLQLAMDNCPHQAVLCGSEEDVGIAARKLRHRGALCTPLPFSRAYHTPRFEPFCQQISPIFGQLVPASPDVDIYSCVTARRYPADAAEFRKLAVAQWAAPVRFRETIEAMYDAGNRVFVEVGPKNHLASFAGDTLRGKRHLAIASNVSHRSGIVQLNHTVALLAAHEVELDPAELYRRRSPRILDFDAVAEHGPAADPLARPLPTGLQLMRLTEKERAAPRTPTEVPVAAVAAAAACVPAGRPRDGVMRQYLQGMDQFLQVQQEVMQTFLAKAAAPPRKSPRMSLVGEIHSLVAARELFASRRLDLSEDLFLADHTFGGSVSAREPGLRGLAVMPLTLTMEMAAQAASLLAPGRKLTGMRNVQAYRWVVPDDEGMTLHLHAKLNEARPEQGIEVQIGHEDGTQFLTATVLFSNCDPATVPAGAFALSSPRASQWTSARLYSEIMFHGPKFQAVQSIDQVGSDGAIASLQAPSTNGFFRSQPDPHFITHPVLLDAAGQVVGFWIAESRASGFHVFPFRLESLDVWNVETKPGEHVTCRVRIRAVREDAMCSDIELVAPGGELMARLTGWEDKRFDLPDKLYKLRVSPGQTFLSSPFTSFAGCRIIADLPFGILESHGRIWERVLAHLVLGTGERSTWRNMPAGQERLEWLLGRAAAKDAIRILTADGDKAVYPADIAIESSSNGRSVSPLDPEVLFSVTHSGEVTAAIAAHASRHAGVGIGLESLSSGSPGERPGLSPEDLSLLRTVALRRNDEWQGRFRCAKEAVLQALDWGAMKKPALLPIERADFETGDISIQGLTAHTFREGNLIGAISFKERV